MSGKELVGSVLERKTPASSNPPRASTSSHSGFPAVEHRSKSAFARNRGTLRNHRTTRLRGAPSVIPAVDKHAPTILSAQTTSSDSWRDQISEENQRKVGAMTDEEREEEKKWIFERFGPEIGSILKRAKEAREGAAPAPGPTSIERGTSAPPVSSISRPPSRVRFAELQPQDVHVYQSAPPSPRRKPIALPRPPENDDSIVSLRRIVSRSSGETPAMKTETLYTATEGTPEFIRQHYFPDAAIDDPNLAWLKAPPEAEQGSSSTLRFDLSGTPIPLEVLSTLPTHLGLHHHAEGYHAGYTLDDIFLLSRSSVPSQRAIMLGILARIAKQIASMKDGETTGLEELIGKEEELRKRMLAAGLEAMNVRGSVGARAIELAWTCVVKWDEKLLDVHIVELQSESDVAISSIQLDYFLPQVAAVYAQGSVTPESLVQLLAILHRLAQQSNGVASRIVMTAKLIPDLVKIHLTTPVPLPNSSSYPDPDAIDLLTTIALASRSNAEALVEYGDALLRFVTLLPEDSPFPTSLTMSLLTSTLRFYTTLGSYGFYAHIASTAMVQLMELEHFINSPKSFSRKLCTTWADLLSIWTICAVDPHRTSPPHEILWSQVTGFGWHAVILELRNKVDVHEHDREVWGAVWRAETAWLMGCRLNAVRGGQEERAICSAHVREGFMCGKEKRVIEVVLDGFRQRLIVLNTLSLDDEWVQNLNTLIGHANTLASAINFWVACAPPLEGSLFAPPFLLPFSRISDLCEQLVKHPLWSTALSHASYIYALVRPLSGLLLAYLGLSRRLPGTTEDLWMAQALSIITRLLPGHEESALDILEEIFQTLTVDWFQSKGYHGALTVVESGGFDLIKPFLKHKYRPNQSVHVSPSPSTVTSIALATTQRLPSVINLPEFGLPLKCDWTLSPLDHLLRSGTSPIFQVLPENWNGSEVEVVRAVLLFTQATRDILTNYGLSEFTLGREEAVFSCMKVYMLEHEQPQADSSIEVFRDATVTQLMEGLLQPYTYGTVTAEPLQDTKLGAKESLEAVATRFLGSSTPFFQYYTDFVALYDAISFAHPLFARLLLPPLSMRYALDYRKHFWDDFGHATKTIRTRIEQVITADIREYLYPVEDNTQILQSYLRALINDTAQEFLQLVAIHHVASNIWPDLGEESMVFNEERGISLLKTIAEQGGEAMARKVVTYRQAKGGEVLLPPSCYDDFAMIKDQRLGHVQRWKAGELLENLQGLFM
ncbi:hypothetical protein AX15_000113 [Amanita polypyramis BW_CC]|nr:hypothetical protein AX15_000113 [Amanita polypyramis BW_CC]